MLNFIQIVSSPGPTFVRADMEEMNFIHFCTGPALGTSLDVVAK